MCVERGGSTGPHSKIGRKRGSNGSTHWVFVIKLDIIIIECGLVEPPLRVPPPPDTWFLDDSYGNDTTFTVNEVFKCFTG